MEPLFETTTEMTLEEYKKFNFYVLKANGQFVWISWLVCTGYLGIRAIAGLIQQDWIEFGTFLVLVVGIPALFYFSYIKTRKKSYAKNCHDGLIKITTLFYQDYFEIIDSLSKGTVSYSLIYNIIENDSSIYIMMSNFRGNVIIKRNCSPELIAFIQNLPAKQKKYC